MNKLNSIQNGNSSLKLCPFCGTDLFEIHIKIRGFTGKFEKSVAYEHPKVGCVLDEFQLLYEKLTDWNRRTQPENKENQAIIRQAMQEIKEYHCGDDGCLLPDSKLDDSGYWADDDACKGCTYGACYRALERSLYTAAPENKPLSLEELRQMERCPVWAIDGAGHSDYVLMDSTGGIDSDTGIWDIDFYNMTGVDGKLHVMGWLAYAHKAEREEK